LVKKSKLHSSRSHFEDVQDVLEGRKHIALVDTQAADAAIGMGLVVDKLPEGSFGSLLSNRLVYLVYKPGEEEYAEKVLYTLKRYPLSKGPRGIDYHREIGSALGYPKEDIDYFIEEFFGSGSGSGF